MHPSQTVIDLWQEILPSNAIEIHAYGNYFSFGALTKQPIRLSQTLLVRPSVITVNG
jgi:hypothetical protein